MGSRAGILEELQEYVNHDVKRRAKHGLARLCLCVRNECICAMQGAGEELGKAAFCYLRRRTSDFTASGFRKFVSHGDKLFPNAGNKRARAVNHAQTNALPFEEAHRMRLRIKGEMLQGSNGQAPRHLRHSGREGQQLGGFESIGEVTRMHIFIPAGNHACLDARKCGDVPADRRQIQKLIRHEKILEHVLVKSGERQGRRRRDGFRRWNPRLGFRRGRDAQNRQLWNSQRDLGRRGTRRLLIGFLPGNSRRAFPGLRTTNAAVCRTGFCRGRIRASLRGNGFRRG